MRFLDVGVIVVLVVGPAFSQSPQRPAAIAAVEPVRSDKVVAAIRISDKINLDGVLEEDAWRLALPAKDFLQWEPRNGEPSTQRTEVRFLYDDDNLYVGANCFDSDAAHMVVNQLQEDFPPGETDSFSVVVDGFHDGRGGYIFRANPAGARSDGQSLDNVANNDWDGVWDVKTSRNDEGWIAEFVIPFKTLRFSQSTSQEWGVNMTRRILSINEEIAWTHVPTRYRAVMRLQLAGTLTGLENIHQGRNLKVKPFITAGITQARNASGMQTLQSLGRFKDYDGGVDVKYGLTQSVTLDLTYRTDFAQVEADTQQVNLTRFNIQFPEKREFFLENAGTFRFGGDTNLVPFFSRRLGLSAAGTPVPIVGGGRVSGKIKRYSLGVLGMKTESVGTTPSSNYLVGRFTRNFMRNSWLGMLVTNRDSTRAGDYNRVYGADSYVQLFDKLDFNTYLLKSDTPGKSGNNQARKLDIGWRDEEYTISTAYHTIQSNFNPEVGFVRRRDFVQYSGDVSWRPRLRRSKTIRNLIFETATDYYEAPNGKVETRTETVNLGFLMINGGSVNFTVDQTFDRLTKPFQIRSDLSIASGDYAYRSYKAAYIHRPSGYFSGEVNYSWGDFWDGNKKAYGGAFIMRPNYRFNAELSYSRNDVKLSNGSFTTDLVGLRFVYGFSPRSFINGYIQYNADTHNLSSNIRFNITHHPLSDLYVVYNDRRDTVSGQLVERALIVKLTNLFNF